MCVPEREGSAGKPPVADSFGEIDYQSIKLDLMEYALKNRCQKFIGNGKQCLNIVEANADKSFQGFSGYRGLVAYVSKQMTTPEDLLIGFDFENNDLIPSA